MSATKHMCFFSTIDNSSQILIEQLKNTPFFREFRFFCVDPLKTTGKRPVLPKYVTAVPMLVIEEEPKPLVLVDSAIQNWISERLLRESGTSGFDVGNGFGGDLNLGDPSYSPFSELTAGTVTSPAPPITNRLEGTMVSYNDASFGTMTSPDAPLSAVDSGAGAGAGGVAKGIKPPSQKAQEMQSRMDAMLQARAAVGQTPMMQMQRQQPNQQMQQQQMMMRRR